MTSYHFAEFDGKKIFYREAGVKSAPTILLLHGFPTSSHMFRNLIPTLAEHYHVVAPDLPGFGFSITPDRKTVRYNFENLTKVIGKFIETIERWDVLRHLRLRLRRTCRFSSGSGASGAHHRHHLPERQCLRRRLERSMEPDPEAYWKDPTEANRNALREFLKPGNHQVAIYPRRARMHCRWRPESYTLDAALLAWPGNDEIQLDFFLDYASNVALYPKFQGALPHQAATAAGRLGQERSFFSAPGRRSIQTRQPERGSG